jgi:hypothetical protein
MRVQACTRRLRIASAGVVLLSDLQEAAQMRTVSSWSRPGVGNGPPLATRPSWAMVKRDGRSIKPIGDVTLSMGLHETGIICPAYTQRRS